MSPTVQFSGIFHRTIHPSFYQVLLTNLKDPRLENEDIEFRVSINNKNTAQKFPPESWASTSFPDTLTLTTSKGQQKTVTASAETISLTNEDAHSFWQTHYPESANLLDQVNQLKEERKGLSKDYQAEIQQAYDYKDKQKQEIYTGANKARQQAKALLPNLLSTLRFELGKRFSATAKQRYQEAMAPYNTRLQEIQADVNQRLTLVEENAQSIYLPYRLYQKAAEDLKDTQEVLQNLQEKIQHREPEAFRQNIRAYYETHKQSDLESGKPAQHISATGAI